MISLDEALERILTFTDPLGSETLNIGAAVNRILAKPVIAQHNQPPFDASAMDGYAVRGDEVKSGTTLQMIGTSKAGEGFSGKIESGQCARIFTGAPMPDGADTVVMQEKTEPRKNNIVFLEDVQSGQNVRLKGNDFKKDEAILNTGDHLHPGAIALAAAANNATLEVYKQPKVTLLATGDELVLPGGELGPDQIVASNSVSLSALISPNARKIEDLGVIPDDVEHITAVLRTAIEGDSDVIVTSGGASVGDHDHIQSVLKSLGVEMDFWRIAMRPGKPLMFGKVGEKLIFGLPGNPVSAMVTATVVLLPALRALAGAKNPHGTSYRLPLGRPLPRNGPRRHFMRANIRTKDDGITAVYPVRQIDSAHLSSLAKSNALIVHMEEAAALNAGELIEVIPLTFS